MCESAISSFIDLNTNHSEKPTFITSYEVCYKIKKQKFLYIQLYYNSLYFYYLSTIV